MQLEEFRKKKEAALAARKLQAHVDEKAPDGVDMGSWKEREEELQSQITQLLSSVDDLHRALNDERHNSSELEQTIAELREEIYEARRDDLKQELEERVSEVKALRERVQALEGEMMEIQTSSMNDKTVSDELRGRVEELESLNAEMASKVQNVSELEAEHAQMKAECEGLLAMGRELEDVKELISVKEREIVRLQGELENAGEESAAALTLLKEEYEMTIQELRQQLDAAAQTQQNETTQNSELESELSELMSQMEQMLQEKEDMESEKQGLLKMSEEAQARLQILEQELMEATNVAEEAVKKKEDVEHELQVMLEQNNALLTLNESLQSENNSQRSQMDALKESANEPTLALEDALNHERSRCGTLEKEVERLKDMEVMYSDQMADFESRCEMAEGRSLELQKIVESLREQEISIKSKYLELEQKVSHAQEPGIKERNSELEMELQTLRSTMQSKLGEKDHMISQAHADIESIREQLNTEKRRSAQLEDFVARNKEQQAASSSQVMGNKKMDDDQDMEAAALAGGSAFKPLVGLVRSLPPPLGNNGVLANMALKIDRAVVALDARPQYRALLILYLLMIHIFVLI